MQPNLFFSIEHCVQGAIKVFKKTGSHLSKPFSSLNIQIFHPTCLKIFYSNSTLLHHAHFIKLEKHIYELNPKVNMKTLNPSLCHTLQNAKISLNLNMTSTLGHSQFGYANMGSTTN